MGPIDCDFVYVTIIYLCLAYVFKVKVVAYLNGVELEGWSFRGDGKA